MKLFTTFIVLFLFSFSKPSYADHIENYKIEGINVGSSLLNYTSENTILKNKYYGYKSKDYYTTWFKLSDYKFFPYVQANIKDGDNKYIIVSLEVGMPQVSFSECKELKKIYEKKVLSSLTKVKPEYKKERSHPSDPSGQSKAITTNFYMHNSLNDGGAIRVMCVDWSEKMENEKGYKDSFRFIANSKEFNVFIDKMFPKK